MVEADSVSHARHTEIYLCRCLAIWFCGWGFTVDTTGIIDSINDIDAVPVVPVVDVIGVHVVGVAAEGRRLLDPLSGFCRLLTPPQPNPSCTIKPAYVPECLTDETPARTPMCPTASRASLDACLDGWVID